MKSFFGDEVTGFAVILNVCAWIGIVVLVIRAFAFFTPDNILIIHFESGEGIDMSGTRADLLLVAVAGGAMILMNFLLVFYLASRERFLSRLLAVASTFFSALIFIAIAVIISVS